jgi:hypothetical protein
VIVVRDSIRAQLLIVVCMLSVLAASAVNAQASARADDPACARGQLSARAYFAGLATGHAAEVVILTDHGGSCVLRGYPRLHLLDGAHHPVHTFASRRVIGFSWNRLPVRTVRLSKGGRASFEIGYSDEPGVLGAGARSCAAISWLGINVAGGRIDVPMRITPCGGGLEQSPVQPGVLAHKQRD